MQRLDKILVDNGLVQTRSQGESYIRMGRVTVNGKVATKSGTQVSEQDIVKLHGEERYVSRAGFKLASAAKLLGLDFADKVVIDVGSSTGGFTDFTLQNGAKKVIAVDVGTDQLHPSLHGNPKIELHEKTDIRDFKLSPGVAIDVAVIDVSFISLRNILLAVSSLVPTTAQIVAMVKPQFEAGDNAKHKGVIKNDTMRRQILKDFEQWAAGNFIIIDKADSEVAGSKGNRERFYLLQKTR